MDLRNLFTRGERTLRQLVLADLLAPRGRPTPLAPPWRKIMEERRRFFLRLLAVKRREAGGDRHG